MTEFWETSFLENLTMWGLEPSDSAILARDFFVEKNVRNVLIPGIGYGRNAKPFLDAGMSVTGIEISQTAISLARQNGLDVVIHHGSVADMPFDHKLYDGIFCYALIHLLDKAERSKFIRDCYQQLKPDGYMIFTAISKEAPMFGAGKQLDQDYYEITEGLRMFFYDSESVKAEFGEYGLVETVYVTEPHKNMESKPPFQFLFVKCLKVD